MKSLLVTLLIAFSVHAETPVPATPEVAEPSHFSVEELEGLADRNDWNQLVLHLEDVVPAQRNARWEAVVERGALGYLSSLREEGTAAEKMSESLLARFPTLARSEKFQATRLETRLAGLDACYQSNKHDACAAGYLKFAAEQRRQSDWLKKAAETVMRRAGAAEAMAYYRLWIENDRRGAAVCEDAGARRVLLAALTTAKGKGEAGELAVGLCWQSLQADFRQAVEKKASATRAICELYRRKKIIQPGCP